jgi:hypothetical protein
MATRTVATGDDVEFALAFLAKQQKTTADDLFMTEVGKVFKAKLAEADKARFEMAQDIMKNNDPGTAVAKLRELLG